MVVERMPFQIAVFMRVPMRLNLGLVRGDLGLVRGDHGGKRPGIIGNGPDFRRDRQRHGDQQQDYATKRVDGVPPSVHAAS